MGSHHAQPHPYRLAYPRALHADRSEGCIVVIHRTSVQEDAENEKTVSKGAISRGFERKGLSVLEAQCFFGGYLPRCSVLAEDGVPALAPLHRKVEVGSRTEVVPVFIDLCNGRGVVLRFCVALVNGGL